jgi:hypothetical protein
MLRTQGASSHAGGANRIVVELLEQGSVSLGGRVGLRLGLRVGQREHWDHHDEQRAADVT